MERRKETKRWGECAIIDLAFVQKAHTEKSKSALHSQRIRLIAVLYGSLSFVNEGVNYRSKFIFDCPCLGWIAPVFVHKFNQVCFTTVAFILNVFTSCSMQVKGWESLHLKYLIRYIISWSILQKRKLKTLYPNSKWCRIAKLHQWKVICFFEIL